MYIVKGSVCKCLLLVLLIIGSTATEEKREVVQSCKMRGRSTQLVLTHCTAPYYAVLCVCSSYFFLTFHKDWTILFSKIP